MSDKNRGLYRKFDVRRTDGSSDAGGKHEHCYYFVLDVTHDKYALHVLANYADACEEEYPELARDLRDAVKSTRPHVVFADALTTALDDGGERPEGVPEFVYVTDCDEEYGAIATEVKPHEDGRSGLFKYRYRFDSILKEGGE